MSVYTEEESVKYGVEMGIYIIQPLLFNFIEMFDAVFGKSS
jgi:hypothetical protein